MENIGGLSDLVKEVFEICFSGTLAELKVSVNKLLLSDSPELKDQLETSNSKKHDEVFLTSLELATLEFIRDSKQRCVSHIAAAGGNLEILNTLLTASPSLAHMEDDNKENSLFYLIRSIITNKFDTDLVNPQKLDDASSLQENRINCLLLLIGLCGINNKNKSGLSPLHVATELGSFEICKILIENNANVNICSKSFSTPLSIAVIKSHTDLIDLLLEHGADPNVTEAEDDDDSCDSKKSIPPPLVYCSSAGNTDLVKKLLENGADPNICDSQGWTSLHCAAESGHLSICKLLIEHGADANIISKNKNAYILAVMNGHDKVAEYLKEFTNESDTFEFLHKSKTENELDNNEADYLTDELECLYVRDDCEDLTPEEIERIKNVVNETRDCGKQLVELKDYTNATNCYSKGLSLCPYNSEFNEIKSILYSNRSFTNLKLKNLKQSLWDAKQAVKLNPGWSKAYLRLANVYKEKGETVDYLHNLFQAFVRDSENSELKRRFQSEFNKHRKG